MWKNYLKIAWRYLWQTKESSMIHVGGLSIAMAAAILILLWSQNELRYDNHHADAERIYLRTEYDSARGAYSYSGYSPYPALDAIIEKVPEVEQLAMAGTNARRKVFEINGYRFKESNALIVDSNWVNMFDYKVLQGSLEYFSNNPRSVVLTRSKAAKYFGDLPPFQQTLHIDSVEYAIAAVIEDIPPHFSFQQDVLISNSVYKENQEDKMSLEHWGHYSQLLFIKMSPGASVEEAEKKISKIFSDNQPWSSSSHLVSRLVPLTDLHFEKSLLNQIIPHGNIRNLWVFTVLAVLLLAVASVNFVNLSIARIGVRMKEIGVRKIVGAAKHHLFAQVMVETFLSIIMATGIALLLAVLILPEFNVFAERNLVLNLLDAQIALLILGVVLLVFTMTGFYPALVLATLKPVGFLKNQALAGLSRQRFRKILVTGQLAFTMAMLVGVATIHRQFAFIQQQTNNYQEDQVFRLNVPFPLGFASNDEEAVVRHRTRVSSVKAGLLASNSIQTVSQVNNASIVDDKWKQPANVSWSDYPEQQEPTDVVMIWADEDYAGIANLTLVSGRWFDPANTADKYNLILNETAVKAFGLEEPVVGTSFSEWAMSNQRGTIIGVIKDYHHKSLHEKIDPIVFTLDPFGASSYLVKANAGNVSQALDHARKVWQEFTPGQPFEYTFLDEEFDRLYKDDRKALMLCVTFGGLSILLSCLGLLGMITVSVQQRTKEIGIRKVMGASITGIVTLLGKDFLKLVMTGFVIAIPVAWWAMNRWLANFAYRIDIEWWMFALAGLAAVVIALVTVSFQSLKAALMNPVDSLRSE